MTSTIESTSLFYSAGNSDKEYHAQIRPEGLGFIVTFQYGRRGGTLQDGVKTKTPVDQAEAKAVFDALIKEKMGKGYTPQAGGQVYAMVSQEFTGILPQLLNPIDEDVVATYMSDTKWVMEEKYDGHRRMMEQMTTDASITSINRKGLRVGLPQETLDSLSAFTPFTPWRVDGELIGSTYVIFDVLHWNGVDTTSLNVEQRLTLIEQLKTLVKTPNVVFTSVAFTKSEKQALYKRLKKERREGVVFKRLDSLYVPGRPASVGDQVKFKFVKTATFFVSSHTADKRSVQLQLFDGATTYNLGSVTISSNFDVPNVGALVEVRYLYAYKNGALAQPCYLGERDDLDVAACVMSQLVYKPEDTDSDE